MDKQKSAGFTPLPFNKVKIDDNFWGPRIRLNAGGTLYSQYEQLNKTHRLPVFKLDYKEGDDVVPHIFWDSDVAKWVEAACYSLQVNPDPRMEKLVDEAVDLIISAQQPDGYLNVYYTVVEPDKRWSNLRDAHELYCAGHLMEAAVAHFRATGSRKFLDCMCRYADYIDTVFGTEPGKKRGYCGHQEIELALIKLYEATGNERYLKLSEYFIEERGRQPYYFDIEAAERGEHTPEHKDHPVHWHEEGRYSYLQADVPIRQQTKVAGHAVRAMYIYSGAADLAGVNGDTELYGVLKNLLDSLISRRMYITGGLGSTRFNEGFTTDYDLPNRTAYAETCAAIGLIFWCHRMLRRELDGRYADAMERALYNGSISGISLSGDRYFYENPLASNGDHHRVEWFGCSCCPVNIVRLIASVGGYIYAQSDDAAVVHLYIQSEGKLDIGGKSVKISQKTNSPWEGDAALTVGVQEPQEFELKLRIPGWCNAYELKINGEDVQGVAAERGYIGIRRTWQDGDSVELGLPMSAKRMYANPNVEQDAGLVAIQRGPIVYCFEQADNRCEVQKIQLPADSELQSEFEPGLLGGVVTIQTEGRCASDEGWQDTLYRDTPPKSASAPLKAIPYYTWDNREPGRMAVWVRESD